MHAPVARAVGLVFEADFPNRAVLLFEHRHHILLAKAKRHQAEQRVFWQHRYRLAGIGNEEPARAAERRLGMAQEALVGIVARAQTVGIGVELREYRIELPQPCDRRAVRYVCACIARRFQLAGAIDSFVEGRQFVGLNGGAGRRVWADDRRMRDLDTPILEIAGGIQ
jgi:hypothetical protein